MTEYTHKGIKFKVGPHPQCPGIVWRIPRGEGWKQSSGAWYEGMGGDPLVLAKTNCELYIDQMLERVNGIT